MTPQVVKSVELTETTALFVPSAEQVAIDRQSDREWRAAIKELLTPTEGIVFCSNCFDGYSYEEIAEALNKDVVTIRKHYSNARKKLQEKLEKNIL